MTPEARVKAEIKAYLNTLKPKAFHFAVHNMGYGRRGIGDHMVCYRSRFVMLEIKAAGGTAAPWQKQVIAEVVEAEGVAEVVWSVDDVRAIIDRIDAELAKQDLGDADRLRQEWNESVD